ncbi:MAG: serine-type D-Ala-D-Ala carboxypeptidase, partial [Beggiatoa sp. IS2]
MKILNLLVLSIGLITFHTVLGESSPPNPPTPLEFMAPPITSRTAILQDFNSGQVLLAKNADERVEPASLTKLMTAYLIFQVLNSKRIALTDTVKISEKAWRMSGSRTYLDLNTTVPVEILLKGMIIQSGNDASVALAEYVGGSEEKFVELMNQQAKKLGLANTHYMNSTGLPDPQHYSTTRDLARIAQAIIQDFPDYYRWYSEKEFTYNKITQQNRNTLLWQDNSVDGMKTGYTESAGYCLVAAAKRGNARLISVIMGADSQRIRAQESQNMLDYGFRAFESYLLYPENQVLNTERIWQGHTSKLPLGLAAPLYVTVPRGQYAQLKVTVHVNQHILAPVEVGEIQGSLRVSLGRQILTERPLIALQSVTVGNI